MSNITPTQEWKDAQKLINASVREQIATLEPSVFTHRIERLLLQSTAQEWKDGCIWYRREGNAIRAYGAEYAPHLTFNQLCGLFAACSPQASVPRNWQLLVAAVANVDTMPAMSAVKAKCRAILAGVNPLDVLGGRKTIAFYLDLSGLDVCAVCVDRHAASAVYLLMIQAVQPAWYDHAAYAFTSAAEAYGILPSQAQAIAWLVWRRLKGLK